MRNIPAFITTLIVLLSTHLSAQAKKEEIVTKHKNGLPSVIRFDETKVPFNKADIESFLKKEFELNGNIDFEVKKEDFDLDINVQKLQQYYKGVRVEYGEIILAAKNGELTFVSGNAIQIDELNTNPSISPQAALESALRQIGAEEYAWENTEVEDFRKNLKNDPLATYYPTSELVIIDKALFDSVQKPVLAYKMPIYATVPLKYHYYYIDANTGDIVFENPIIKHADGIAQTRYSGTRTIQTEAVSNGFRLKDDTRGNGIITYNANNTILAGNNNTVTEFVDNDNNWTAAEYNNTSKDNAALDAHWGAAKTYDYFLNKHNRNSYDNNGGTILGYVHYGINFPGASWEPVDEFMRYGDGSGFRDAVVSLDVVGHEIAHGICGHTADLAYWKESGAINESLSDIWGAMVEHYAAPEKSTYLIGEDIYSNGRFIRSMSHPNSIFADNPQPDTYLGTYWHDVNDTSSDNGGVHINSGVMNYWFYLLAEGGSGTNDKGDEYNLTGIGKEDAAKIVYRAEKLYFTSTTGYFQAREMTMQAAADLFGEMTTIKVANAWYAVGVGNEIQYGSHYITGPTQITPGTGGFYTFVPYVGATHYQWVIPTGCTNNIYCWEIVQGQGTNTALIYGGNTGVQNIACKIYSNSSLMATLFITVNVQNPYNGGGSNPCGELGSYGIIYPPVPCNGGNGIDATERYFIEFTIFDMAGRKILDLSNVDSVDLNFLSKGIYLINARTNTNEIFTKKIAK